MRARVISELGKVVGGEDVGVLGGDEAEQAALLCPGKGTEGEDGPGRKAVNQSRDEEERKRGTKRQTDGPGKSQWVSVEDSPRSGPTQGTTGSSRAPDGEGDRAASLPVRPLLHSGAHTKKGPEQWSLGLGRFLVQVRRTQTQARPMDRRSSAPLTPSRVVAGSSPASPRRRFSSSGRAKG